MDISIWLLFWVNVTGEHTPPWLKKYTGVRMFAPSTAEVFVAAEVNDRRDPIAAQEVWARRLSPNRLDGMCSASGVIVV
jgi:hypothetical protein